MTREPRATNNPATASTRSKAVVEAVVAGEAALVTVSGLVDERFEGFGPLGAAKAAVIDVSGITRMTSFGVRQWLKGMDALPKTVVDLYLLGCPTFFVDQLNMVLNFGGASKVVTVVAPYTCPSCGVESGETLDVLAERTNLAMGALPEKECARCGGKLEFDETPESYFAFAAKYAASSIQPAVAELLAAQRRYVSRDIVVAEKPPKIIKLVHGSVTYFRIIGTIGSMFRARPFLVGAEGELVIDLADVDRVDAAGQNEWRRLLKTLAGQVPSITLVDVTEAFLKIAGDSLAIARNIAVASVLVPYQCADCGRTTRESETLLTMVWPRDFADHVCPTCGGTTRSTFAPEPLIALKKASTSTPPASAKVIEQRNELLSRELTNANVAQAGEVANATMAANDTILGKYKVIRRLSAGGMAEVFLAKQVGIGGFEKPVALKRIQHRLLERRHQAIELFLNEAKIAGRLTHPNIVQVLDVGEVQGALYLAMEYVHGRDLRDLLKMLHRSRSLMPLAESCYVVREVAQALHHAYWSTDMAGKRLNVVHRDVSPHNVILGYDGTVKLLDFGVAMSAVTEHAETMIVGKWMYMSPETTMNEQIDHRSDLFSLGVIMYLLCTGAMPFNGSQPKEIVKKIRAGEYKPVSAISANVPPRLEKLIGRMLAPNPENRPESGKEIVSELNEITRQYGLDSSAQNIASFLAHVFPNQPAGTADEPSIKEIVRIHPEEIDGQTLKDKTRSTGDHHGSDRSPVSITPSAETPSRAGLIDVSETLRRSTADLSIPAVRRSTPSMPAIQPPPGIPQARQRFPEQPSSFRTAFVNVAIVLVIAGVAALVAYLVESSY